MVNKLTERFPSIAASGRHFRRNANAQHNYMLNIRIFTAYSTAALTP
jgi:hypothetical protein